MRPTLSPPHCLIQPLAAACLLSSLATGQPASQPAPRAQDPGAPAHRVASPARPQARPRALARAGVQIDPARLHFDRPGDGDLWVRGASYKARFGVDAVEFIPFLGSDAPRNFPLELSLESISRGEVELEFAHRVAPVHEPGGSGDSDVVSYARGDVVEYYVIESESIEQRFRIDQPVTQGPGAVGDLLIRVAVDSQLECLEGSDGFCFSNELGGVRYGRAVTFDRSGALAASPTRRVDGFLEIRVPEAFLARAQYPLTIDPVISPFNVDAPAGTSAFGDAAYDDTNGLYMISWEFVFSQTDHDVFTQAYDLQGNLIPGNGAWIDTTTDNWSRPRIANSNFADQFLVVAIEGSDGIGEIVGRTRQAAPPTMGIQQLYSLFDTGLNSYVDVGGDPNDDGPSPFCVVWTLETSDTVQEVVARTVNPDGTPAIGFVRWVDNSAGTVDRNPSISKSNGVGPLADRRWTIAWQRGAGAESSIHAARMRTIGNIDAPPFRIDDTSASHSFPSVSSELDGTSGNRPYLVAYQNDGGDIFAKVFAGDTQLTDRLNLSDLEGVGTQSLMQATPTACTDGSTFMVAYPEVHGTNWNLYLSEFDYAAGTLLCTSPHRAVSATDSHEFVPRMCSQRSGGGDNQDFVMVWMEYDLGNTSIGGATVRSQGFGRSYCDSEPNSSGFVGRLSAEGSRSVGYADMELVAVDCPPNVPGLLYLGLSQIHVPFGEGQRCVGGPTARMHPFAITDSNGVLRFQLDFSAGYAQGYSNGNLSVNYQYWFRDSAGGGSQFNLTDALHIEHTP